LPDAFNVETNDYAKHEPYDRPDHPDGSAGNQEYTHDRTLGCTHCAQDGNVLPFILDQHDQSGNDVERSDQHDQRQNKEHHVALDLQSVEERRIALSPIDHEDRPLGGILHNLTVPLDAIRIIGIHLDRSDIAGAVKISLRLLKWHEHHGI